MSVIELPLMGGVPGMICVFAGRGAEPRPEPVALLALLGPSDRRPRRLVSARQIHSERCLVVGPELAGRGGVAGDGDALLTGQTGVALGVATADCVPLVAVDPVARALAVVHAGWRGTVAGVLQAALRRMCTELSARPDRILVSAGPAAGVCCYRVGPEVAAAFRRRTAGRYPEISRQDPDGAVRIDLVEANRLQALDAGVAGARFAATGFCTICTASCHSYRRDGAAAGRNWLLAALL